MNNKLTFTTEELRRLAEWLGWEHIFMAPGKWPYQVVKGTYDGFVRKFEPQYPSGFGHFLAAMIAKGCIPKESHTCRPDEHFQMFVWWSGYPDCDVEFDAPDGYMPSLVRAAINLMESEAKK